MTFHTHTRWRPFFEKGVCINRSSREVVQTELAKQCEAMHEFAVGNHIHAHRLMVSPSLGDRTGATGQLILPIVLSMVPRFPKTSPTLCTIFALRLRLCFMCYMWPRYVPILCIAVSSQALSQACPEASLVCVSNQPEAECSNKYGIHLLNFGFGHGTLSLHAYG